MPALVIEVIFYQLVFFGSTHRAKGLKFNNRAIFNIESIGGNRTRGSRERLAT